MAQTDDNSLQGDYGETWLRAVAASSGLLHGRPTTHGRFKIVNGG
jgi:hypothetical protein